MRQQKDGMAVNIIPAGVYRHTKGNLYRVLCVASHSETLEDMVVYQDLTDESKIWARPASMWREEVDVGGVRRLRFEYVGD